MNYLNRLNKLRAKMNEAHLETFLITHPIDLYYFTGMDLSAGKLVVNLETAQLVVDGRYFEACKQKSELPVLLAEENTLHDLLEAKKELGIDSETTTVQNYLDLEQQLLKHGLIIRPVKGMIKQLRAIKDAEELLLLRDAAKLGSEGFDYIRSLLKAGVYEDALAFEVECYWRKKGAQGVAFDPIIAFGEHSSMPHHRAGNTALKNNQIVLIDIGVHYKHYHSDMTRVVYFGNCSQELRTIHAIVQEASERARALLKPGVTVGELDDAARGFIQSKGYGEYFTHNLGHGVGLEIHEFPTIRRAPSIASVVLQAGMVITIEPGIYLPRVGGVRLEDTVAITENGYENFTQHPYDFSESS